MPLFGGAHFALCAPSGVLYVFLTAISIIARKNLTVKRKTRKNLILLKNNKRRTRILHTLDIIFEELKKQGKTQIQLCEFLGIKKQASTDWKSGKSSSYKKYLPEISDFLEVPIDYLLGNKNTISENKERLSEQEKTLLESFRSTTELGRQRIIQAVLNICDEIEKKDQNADTSSAG